MRHLITALVLAGAVAGCSQQSDRETLTQACVADGEKEETCACITDAMEEKLSPDLFKRTAAAVAREQQDIGDFVSSLPQEQQLEFATVLTDIFSCSLSAPAEE